jgi:hypothetical protein
VHHAFARIGKTAQIRPQSQIDGFAETGAFRPLVPGDIADITHDVVDRLAQAATPNSDQLTLSTSSAVENAPIRNPSTSRKNPIAFILAP